MTASLERLLTHQRVLLIQGKMGSFFSRFASFLHTQGIEVSKINLNAGDAFFYRHRERVYNYAGTLADFDGYLTDLLHSQAIGAVVCFGDCRPHHAVAGAVCRRLGTAFFVFEEGYLRPDYITLQQDGINGYSQLDLRVIKQLQKANDKPLPTHNRFYKLCLAAIVYYIVARAKQDEFPHYTHYRGMTAWQEGITWLKAPVRKAYHYLPDKRLQRRLHESLVQRYFLVSLQVYNDSQITFHSDYADITVFIDEVMTSFAQHAPCDLHLVFKHHPLDRAHRHYGALIAMLAKKLGITGRVHYGCDMHLPTLIRDSLGMVTINSTTGLQSIYHNRPTKVMGRAIYNVPQLTDQQPLDGFWQHPMPPDQDFYQRFREYLIEQTQLNGSFYGDSPWMGRYLANQLANQAGANQPATMQAASHQAAVQPSPAKPSRMQPNLSPALQTPSTLTTTPATTTPLTNAQAANAPPSAAQPHDATKPV